MLSYLHLLRYMAEFKLLWGGPLITNTSYLAARCKLALNLGVCTMFTSSAVWYQLTWMSWIRDY